jgi:hypothetical protein
MIPEKEVAAPWTGAQLGVCKKWTEMSIRKRSKIVANREEGIGEQQWRRARGVSKAVCLARPKDREGRGREEVGRCSASVRGRNLVLSLVWPLCGGCRFARTGVLSAADLGTPREQPSNHVSVFKYSYMYSVFLCSYLYRVFVYNLPPISVTPWE